VIRGDEFLEERPQSRQHGNQRELRVPCSTARGNGISSPAGSDQGGSLRDVHVNTLRHSTASFLLAAGTHRKVMQEHLGHSSYAITADIYSQVGPAQQREVADRLAEALRW
jgi:integrase